MVKFHKNNFAGKLSSSLKSPLIIKELHEERKFNNFAKGYFSKLEKEAKQNYESRKHWGRCGKFH